MADYEERYDSLCSFAENRLQAHGKMFIAGTNNITVADCKFGHIFYGAVYNDDNPFTLE